MARWPNSVEIVSSELDCRGAFFFCGRVTDYHTCRSESRVDTETHGGGEFGAAGRDQTRRTPINPRNRTAPQIKMHPGHSICVPLPSSQHDFRVGIISSLQENHFTKTIPSLSCQNEILKCIWSSANHFTEILVCTQFERLERERSTNPHLPWPKRAKLGQHLHLSPTGSPVKWVWWSFYTRETDSGEEQHKQEGEMSKPFAFFYHSSKPNILYYNNDYSIHIFQLKSMLILFFDFFCLFLKKKKRQKLKYLSKK